MTSSTPNDIVPTHIAGVMPLHHPATSVRRLVRGLEAPVTTLITLALLLDQEGCARAGCVEPTGLPTADQMQHFHHAVAHETPSVVKNRANWLGHLYHTTATTLALVAIDPESGDSVLHTGVRAGRLDNLSAVQRLFNIDPPDYIRGYFLPRHSNHAGETVMHVAARGGDLIMAIAACRLLARHSLPNRDELNSSNHHEPGDPNGPVEYRDEFRYADEHLISLPSRNNSGQDAAAIARESGHEQVAQWVKALIARRDPKRIRNDPLTMAELVKEVREDEHFEYTEIPDTRPEEDEDDDESEDEDEVEGESGRVAEEGNE